MTLLTLIEQERTLMHQLADKYGLGDERTIEQSQRLDGLIVREMKRDGWKRDFV